MSHEVTLDRLYGPAQPTDTGSDVLFTVPTDQQCTVKQIIMANTTAGAATLTIGVDGVAAADQIVPGISIDANQVVTMDLTFPMDAGEAMRAVQGTASAVTVTVSGVCEDLTTS